MVLLLSVLLAARISSSFTTQFWLADYHFNHSFVHGDSESTVKFEAEDILELPADLRTVIVQSCDSDLKMTTITAEQKQIFKTLYKDRGNNIQTEFHIEFLSKIN